MGQRLATWSLALILLAPLLGAAGEATGQERRFERPRWGNHRLDICLQWAQSCGQPAADAFCQRHGFSGAIAFAFENDIGHRDPTVVLGTGQVCNQPFCDGFAYITCGSRQCRTNADCGRCVCLLGKCAAC